METRAVAKYIRVSPQKARLVTDMIKGKDLLEAQHLLEYSEKAVAGVLSKLLASAAANAENNNSLNLEDLYIARAYVDEGPTLPQRYRMRAQGRVGRIRKRTSHITVVLEEREPDKGMGKKKRFAIRRPRREKPEEVLEQEEIEEEEFQNLEIEELEAGGELIEESMEDAVGEGETAEDDAVEEDALEDETVAGDVGEKEESDSGGSSVDQDIGSPADEGDADEEESLEKGEE